jgi:phage shock protein E
MLGACGTSTTGRSTPTVQIVSTVAAASPPGARVVAPAEAKALLNEGGRVLIDVRTPAEYAQGHLAGAKLIDFNAPGFKEQIALLDHNARYVIYCHSGNRSGQARQIMADQGFVDVADIQGGIQNWAAAHLPIEK